MEQKKDPSEVSPEHLSESIRFHRKKSGLSQMELATLAGVGKTVIFDLESGKKSVRLDTLRKVLGVLNMEMVLRSPVMKEFNGRLK